MKSKKDSYWFPHDCNARNDPKVIKLRRILGWEGYGLYFALVETLREQEDYSYPLAGVEDLAYEWHISKEKILAVITEFNLFEVDDQAFFFSKSLLQRMQPWDNVRRGAIKGGKKSAKVQAEKKQLALELPNDGDSEGGLQGPLKAPCNKNIKNIKNNKNKTKLIKQEIDFEFKSEQDKELYELLTLKGLAPAKALNCFNDPARRKILWRWFADTNSGGKQRELKQVTPRSPDSETLIRSLFGAMKSQGHRI